MDAKGTFWGPDIVVCIISDLSGTVTRCIFPSLPQDGPGEQESLFLFTVANIVEKKSKGQRTKENIAPIGAPMQQIENRLFSRMATSAFTFQIIREKIPMDMFWSTLLFMRRITVIRSPEKK
jgi:hypothetical protein